jgi:hypothetical protein
MRAELSFVHMGRELIAPAPVRTTIGTEWKGETAGSDRCT